MNDDDAGRPGLAIRLFGALWRLLDWSRRVAVNLLFLAIVIALVASAFGGRPRVPASAALVIDPKGAIVEQLSGNARDRLVNTLSGSGPSQETLLKDLLDAIRAGKDDARIKVLFLNLDEMGGAGMSKLQDLRAALVDFKKSGKKVIAAGDDYTQAQYYLAAHADEVFLHPMGMVLLEGFGGYRRFYKEGLDKLGIEVHVFRVGEYKSAVEPYLRDGMSAETKEALRDVYGDLWQSYLADVAAARKLQPEEVAAGIDALPDRLRAAEGDFAVVARDAKLVDTLAPRDEVKKRLIALVGEDKETKSYNRISFRDYLVANGGDRSGSAGKGDAVAVVVAKGEILDGAQPPGTIGGDSTAALIRQSRQDDSTRAIVLRVDSPGGSAFASEVIRRELELSQAAGKPVVVSMGSVAASGGYWISTASDEIWANPNTVTGSIGIFGVFPTVEKPMAKYLGVHVDGVGTTRFTDPIRVDRALGPEIAEALQLTINHGYEEFLARVGKARKMTREQVDKIARGRIWSGEDAKALGLVDQLGGLTDAIEAAGKRAKLAKGYRVVYVQKEQGLKDRLLSELFSGSVRLLAALGVAADAEPPSPLSPVERTFRSLKEELGRMARWNDPRGLYAHCLCAED
ncbi:MAG: signal peptide peptidase SppA [Solirubrobacterales bacterium]